MRKIVLGYLIFLIIIFANANPNADINKVVRDNQTDLSILESNIFKQIKTNLAKNLPDLQIDRMVKTPIQNIYEVDAGHKVLYVESTGEYIFVGNLLDVVKKTNLTKERVDSLNQVNWQLLPINIAIRHIIGNGKNRIAIFTDPDCPFCRRLEAETVPKLQNVTIYYFLFPLSIHVNAVDNSRQILCAENPESALITYMLKNMQLTKNKTCISANKLQQMQFIGNSLIQIDSTPTIILPNGKIIQGLLPADYLNQLINENEESKSIESQKTSSK